VLCTAEISVLVQLQFCCALHQF